MLFICLFFSGGRRGQRGGQTGVRKNQMEKHETAGCAELEKEIVTVTQQFENMSTTVIGGIFG